MGVRAGGLIVVAAQAVDDKIIGLIEADGWIVAHADFEEHGRVVGIRELDDGVHHESRDAAALGLRCDTNGADFVLRPGGRPHAPHPGIA